MTRGEIFDVAVDIRRGSPTFGRWIGVTLSAENFRQCYVPAGFAHGFYVTSEAAEIEYNVPTSTIRRTNWASSGMIRISPSLGRRKTHCCRPRTASEDEGLGLFCGLNVIPKKSYLAEYSSRVDHAKTTQLLAAWHRQAAPEQLFAGASFKRPCRR